MPMVRKSASSVSNWPNSTTSRWADTVSVFESMEEKAEDFTITGIYSDSTMATQRQQLPFKDPMTNRSNEILTSQAAIAKKTSFLEGSGYLDPQFFLKDSDQLAAFTKELKAKELSSSYKVNTDAASYKKITPPVGSLQNWRRSSWSW